MNLIFIKNKHVPSPSTKYSHQSVHSRHCVLYTEKPSLIAYPPVRRLRWRGNHLEIPVVGLLFCEGAERQFYMLQGAFCRCALILQSKMAILITASPCRSLHAPTSLSTQSPAPIIGESPTRPCIFHASQRLWCRHDTFHARRESVPFVS